MKSITPFFIMLFLFAQFVQGEQIYSFDSTIDATEINHVGFIVLRNLELQVEGSTNGILLFLALDSLNYQYWSDFLNYTTIFQEILTDTFDFKFFAFLEVNSTLHLLFINNETLPVDLTITIEELTTTNEKTPFVYFSFLISVILLSLVYKKSIRSS